MPEGQIRPSMDQMRESVFACLGNITGCSFLDLFSGSGIIALEAASRGAQDIVAVENDILKRKTLLENAAISPVRIQCRFMSAEIFVKRTRRFFDFIFLDPPFPYRFKWELACSIAVSQLMSEKTVILMHRPFKDDPKGKMERLEIYDSRKYGRSVVDFMRINDYISSLTGCI